MNSVYNKILLIIAISLQLIVYSLRPVYGIEVYLQLLTHGKRVNLGISEFSPGEPEEASLTKEMRQVVRSDLLLTHLFDLIEGEQTALKLKDWKNIGAQALISAEVRIKKENLVFKGKLIDLETGEEIFSKVYETKKESWRELVHRFSDDIVFRFTGEEGIAQSKIVFVNDASGNKEIYLIDYDGENLEQLTDDNSLVLIPRWDSTGQSIVYTSYRNGNPDLYRFSLSKRSREPLLEYQGLNLAGSFSPDDKYLLATLTKDGNPEIYLIDLENNLPRRLTRSKSVEIAPFFSPNAKEIVFVSDRLGNPQIYLMDREGLNVRRITESGYCDSPVWSPKGNFLAYVRRDNENFQIFLLSLKEKKEIQLTFFGSNENPTFSPDGRWIVFVSNRNGKYELYRMLIDGSVQQRLVDLPGESRTPSWSR